MTVKEIMAMSWDEVSSLSAEEVRKATNVLASAANKRLKRMRSSSLTRHAPAVQGVRKFSVRRMKPRMSAAQKANRRNRDLKEFSRARNFLKAKTSTRRGFAAVEKATAKRLQSMGTDYARLSPSMKRKFWSVYNSYVESHPAEVYNQGSDLLQFKTYEYMFKGRQGWDLARLVSYLDRVM